MGLVIVCICVCVCVCVTSVLDMMVSGREEKKGGGREVGRDGGCVCDIGAGYDDVKEMKIT